MELRPFLDRVLPQSGGVYFGAYTDASEKFRQQKLNDLDALTAFIESSKKLRHNVYFATGVYKSKREAEKTAYKRSLYVDVDCGEGKPYPNKRRAGAALVEFCAATKFPAPTYIIDSGGGIHAYWVFDRDISLEVWQPLASAFKQLCLDRGFHIDPAITADPARILRVPTTVNFKDANNPRPVRILSAKQEDYPLELIRKKLGQVKTSAGEKLAALADDDDLASGLGTPLEFKKYAKPMIEKCGVLTHTYDTGGANQEEPLWMQVLYLLGFTEDGHEYIHVMSQDHASYNYQSTERKFQRRLEAKARGHGPTTCEFFRGYYPEICAGCRFNGKIRSPAVLGREDYNEMPTGFRQDELGIERAVAVKGEEGYRWKRILPFKMEDVQLYHNPNSPEGVIFKYIACFKDSKIPVTIPLGCIGADRRSAIPILSQQNAAVSHSAWPDYRDLMDAWYEKMMKAKAIKTQATQMGWGGSAEKPTFTLVDRVISTRGDVKEAIFLDKNFVRDYQPKGSREPWISLAHELTSQNRHPITAAILSSYAAPLIHFTGVSGALLSIVSEESGSGKTTALKLAQAAWGDPQRAIHSLHDTINSVVKRMGFLNNLPAYWDELKMRDDVQNFVKLVFQIGQGKEKSRLKSDTSTQDMGTWQTLITVASNESIVDHIQQASKGTDAGLVRAFEVTVPPLGSLSIDIKTMTSTLNQNFGHVGPEYAEYLVNNFSTVKAMVDSIDKKLHEKFQTHASERFHMAVLVTLITAAHLANKLGHTNIDLAQFQRWLLSEFEANRLHQRTKYVPLERRAIDCLFDFVNEHCDNILQVDYLTRRGRSNPGVLHFQPQRGAIVGVLAREDHALRIHKSKFTDWVYTRKSEMPTRILDELKRHGADEVRASVTMGVKGVDARVYALEIELDNPVFSDLLDSLPSSHDDVFED